MDGVADEECGRLRPTFEQELGIVEHVLLTPVRGDLAARRPEQADDVGLRPGAPGADGVDEQRIKTFRRLDRSRSRVGILAVGVAPGEHRLHPAFRLLQCRRIPIGQAQNPGHDGDRQEAGEVAVQLERRALGEPRDPVGDDGPDGGHGQLADGVGPPRVRQRAMQGLVLSADQRAKIAPSHDLRSARQRACRFLEQVLAALDERAPIVGQDEPGGHILVPQHRPDRAHRLVRGIGIHVAKVAQRDRGEGAGAGEGHTTSASMPR